MGWRELPSGARVMVPDGAEMAVVSVRFSDPDELPRELPLLLNGRKVERVEVSGAGTEGRMDYLEGFEVMDRPNAYSASRMGAVVEAFLKSGNDCMGKRYDDVEQLKRDAYCVRQLAEAHGAPVKASKRGDVLILTRADR